MATQANITRSNNYFLGEAKSLKFTVVDSAAARQDMTGWTLRWRLFVRYDSATPMITKTGASIVLSSSASDSVKDVATVAVVAADVTEVGQFYYDLWRTDSGSEQCLAYGFCEVR